MIYALLWFMAALLFLVIETAHPGLFFWLSFSIGCLGASLITFTHWSSYAPIFALIVGIISFFFLRRYVRSLMNSKQNRTNMNALIGKKVKVLEEIFPDKAGKIKQAGDIWVAYSFERCAIGEYVEIESVGGAHVMVKRNNKEL